MKIPTLQACEKALGAPASAWVARCYEIACAIVKAKLVPGGEAVYGHWLGPIARTSHFASRASMGFTPHGWIYVQDEGLVIDPTRWAFEAVTPYLYSGREPDAWDSAVACKNCQLLEEEHDCGHDGDCGLYEVERWPYDEGGNKWRAAVTRGKPVPKPKKGAKRLPLKLSSDVAAFVGGLLGQSDGTRATDEQIFYLANLPYQMIAGAIGSRAVREIYDAICDAGTYFIEFIPLDNRTKAKREAGFARV
jgi:hypothetical protein